VSTLSPPVATLDATPPVIMVEAFAPVATRVTSCPATHGISDGPGVADDTHSAARRFRSVADDTQRVAGSDHCVGYIKTPVIQPARTCTESTLAGRSIPGGVSVTRTLVDGGTLRMNASPD
jgi:hypothetical protein